MTKDSTSRMRRAPGRQTRRKPLSDVRTTMESGSANQAPLR